MKVTSSQVLSEKLKFILSRAEGPRTEKNCERLNEK